MTRRPSAQTASVLAAFAADPQEWRYGYALGQEVGLKAGSLYPILMRLSDRGLLESRWEQDPSPGRPARHLYRLTGAGLQVAEQVAQARTQPRGHARAAQAPIQSPGRTQVAQAAQAQAQTSGQAQVAW